MRTHGLARAGRIGLAALLFALAASAQTVPEAAPAPDPIAPAITVAPAAGEAPVDALIAEPSAAEPPIPVENRVSLIEQAWLAPASGLDARVAHTRRTSLELGAWSLDAAARALAAGDQSATPLERAAAAVDLAPDLPAARISFARALWLEGGEPIAAIRAAIGAVSAIGRHLEASLWFTGSGLFVLATALVAGGLLAAVLAGSAALAHAAHDLGHLLPRSTPGFARFAGLAALLALPLALGEGVLGLALALLGVGVIYGAGAHRAAFVLAAAGIGIGAYPAIRYAGAALTALPADPVAQATWAVAQGIPTPVESQRLAALAPSDALAARGLAIQARRTGDDARADELYQQLLATGADDIAALNNAADVQLALGHTERAIELYGLAARGESPVVLFNLAQAYGRAFRVEDLNQTIAHAQRAGGEQIARLTALQSGGAESFVADLPPSPRLFWSRALRSGAGAELAQEFRDHFAPGQLGRDPRVYAAAAAAIALLGGVLGARVQPSRACRRCRERICRRCGPRGGSGDLCDGCTMLFFTPEKTDRVLRAERVNELRAREVRTARLHTWLSLLVPGAAGLVAERPLLCWLGATYFALGCAAFVWREGVVPDPLVAGAVAPVLFLGTAGFAAVGYAIAVAAAFAARRQD
jgi:tetratricopeptide (TPR) repeat protein